MKHTKGKWEYVGGDNNSVEVNIGETTASITRYCKNTGIHVIDRSEMEANAKLIAEAGTVANETGKTPRQLAGENKELLGALLHLKGIQTEFGEDSSRRKILRVAPEDWKLILETIKKATK